MLLHDTTAVVLISLGLITLGVCYERVSRIAGGENVGDFSQLRELNGNSEQGTMSYSCLNVWRTLATRDFRNYSSNIQIMHIREVVSKNYSPRGNFIKV